MAKKYRLLKPLLMPGFFPIILPVGYEVELKGGLYRGEGSWFFAIHGVENNKLHWEEVKEETPAERITVEQMFDLNNQYQEQFIRTGFETSKPIPEDKFPAIKQAIESVVNGDFVWTDELVKKLLWDFKQDCGRPITDFQLYLDNMKKYLTQKPSEDSYDGKRVYPLHKDEVGQWATGIDPFRANLEWATNDGNGRVIMKLDIKGKWLVSYHGRPDTEDYKAEVEKLSKFYGNNILCEDCGEIGKHKPNCPTHPQLTGSQAGITTSPPAATSVSSGSGKDWEIIEFKDSFGRAYPRTKLDWYENPGLGGGTSKNMMGSNYIIHSVKRSDGVVFSEHMDVWDNGKKFTLHKFKISGNSMMAQINPCPEHWVNIDLLSVTDPNTPGDYKSWMDEQQAKRSTPVKRYTQQEVDRIINDVWEAARMDSEDMHYRNFVFKYKTLDDYLTKNQTT